MPRLMATTQLHHVPGFRATGVHAGIKRSRPDVALIVSDTPGTTGAAVFTQNAFAAAPVHVSRQHVADGNIQAIVCNSGNANACTGRQGLRDALRMAQETADALGIQPEQVLVTSTGIIGRPLPIDKVCAGIHACAESLDDAVGGEAAQAIMTTDSGPKEVYKVFRANGRDYQIAGIAKGAGMIHPNMATMLAFLATDAPVQAGALRSALQRATELSYNQISVDGDESTNDTAAILASGASGGESLHEGHPEWPAFQGALNDACTVLAQKIAGDGEGATRLLEVVVEGAPDDAMARRAARAVAASNLVKAAIHGADPNWGRIVSTIGSELPDTHPERVDIAIGARDDPTLVLVSGEPIGDALPIAAAGLQAPEVAIHVRLGSGPGQGTAWGCDLTEDYVSFNSAYTT